MRKNVLEELEKNRREAQMRAERNLAIAKGNGEFMSLYTSIKKMELEGEGGEAYKSCVLGLEKVLKGMGMTFDDLLPHYQCDKCHDTGFVEGKECSCLREKRTGSILSSLGGRLDRTHTFENADYNIFDNIDNIHNIYNKMEQWCDESEYKCVLLCGNTGTGKTYLAECILNKFIEKGVDARFYSAFSLISKFLKFHTTFSSEEDKMDILQDVLSVPVLVVDDLGSEPKYNNVTQEYMYVLLNERLQAGLRTVFTTNLSLNELSSRYGERVLSRLCNKSTSLTIKMSGGDVRLK